MVGEVDISFLKSLRKELETKYHVKVMKDALKCSMELLRGPLRSGFTGGTEKEKLRHLLTEACELTVSELHDKVDVKKLDDTYSDLHQYLVERAELVKESSSYCTNTWLTRLSRELNKAHVEFTYFLRHWVTSSEIPALIHKLEAICHSLHLALESEDLDEISNYLTEFFNLSARFLRLIRRKHHRAMDVTCDQVEEITSRLTGIPVPRLPTKVVHRPLSKMVVEHDAVIEELCPAFGDSERVKYEARKFFKPEFMNLDRVFAFRKLFWPLTVARLLIREWVVSVNERKFMVYPFADISKLLHKKGIINAKEIEKWLAENIFPTLSEMVTNGDRDETFAVYVDTLGGSTELSFRLESCPENLAEDWYFQKTTLSLRKLIATYKTEREVINLTLKLEGIFSDLKDRLNTGMLSKEVQLKVELADLICPLKNMLLSFRDSLASMAQCRKLEALPEAMKISNDDCQKGGGGSVS